LAQLVPEEPELGPPAPSLAVAAVQQAAHPAAAAELLVWEPLVTERQAA
jgi:hypothetical protein